MQYQLLPSLTADEYQAYFAWEKQRANEIYLEIISKPLGYIYVLQGLDGGDIKIGATYGPPRQRKRTIELQVGCPLKIIWLMGIRGDLYAVEKMLHHRFKEERLYGEWFYPSPRLMDCLQRLHEDANKECNQE